jgi:ABC-type amino acid transport substrate-binding protein
MSGGQLSRAAGALDNMSPEQIVKALREGRLDAVLAGNDPALAGEFVPPEGADQGARGKTFRSSRDWLRSLSADQIVAELKAGRLDGILADGE